MSDNGNENIGNILAASGIPFRNFEGVPDYEKKLNQPCFYTHKKCHRAECPRWVGLKVGVPSQLVGGGLRMVELRQCWDDYVTNMLGDLVNWKNMVTLQARGAQEQAAQRLVPPPGGRLS